MNLDIILIICRYASIDTRLKIAKIFKINVHFQLQNLHLYAKLNQLLKNYCSSIKTDDCTKPHFHPYWVNKCISQHFTDFAPNVRDSGRQPKRFMYSVYDNEDLDNTIYNIIVAVFPIDGFFKSTTIRFPQFVTKRYAIETMESFLSEVITPNYYYYVNEDYMKDIDLGYRYSKPECWIGQPRGALLSDHFFLELTNVDEKGMLTIICGS